MNSKKILMISPNLCSGGAERQMVTVALFLKKKGCDVEFICYSKGDFYQHILTNAAIKVHTYILPGYLKRLFFIRRFIRKNKYDAVISFLESPNFINNFATLGGKSWKVITGERSAQEKTFKTLKNKVFCWFQRCADYIVCNSDNARNMWIKHFPIYQSKLRTIYNTVILQPVTTEYQPKVNNRTNIVVAASYQYLKNPIGVINAILLMSAEERASIHIDWYGSKEVITGDTKAYDEVLSLVESNQLHDCISLHSNTKEIHNLMNKADIVGLFSRVEGLPNAICEGMSLGKPIIMSKVSDYSKLVDETNGYLCDWDSAESIKNVLVAAGRLSKEELLCKGEASKIKANLLFDEDEIASKWLSLLF